MKKHTTLNIDTDLREEARRALGTRGPTGTIHRALMEVVAYRKRLWLAGYDFPDLTPESVERMRQPRTFESMVLVHYDQDFDTIAGVTGQPVRWVAPWGTL